MTDSKGNEKEKEKGDVGSLQATDARTISRVALRDSRDKKRRAVEKPRPQKEGDNRVFYLADALSAGMRTSGTRVHARTRTHRTSSQRANNTAARSQWRMGMKYDA